MLMKEIDQKYIDRANILEASYFKVVYELDSFGWPVGQHRELRRGKTQAAFNTAHGQIWKAHEAELIAEGYMELPPPHIPARDLAAELDELKGKVAALEAK